MEQKQEMHDVVEMLLSRMRDYPEDFVGDPADYRDMTENKWKKALRLVSGVVAPHEKEALDIRLEEARRAVYMGAALKTIMSDGEPENSEITFHSGGQEKYRIDANGSLGIGISNTPVPANSIQLGKTLLTECDLKAMKQYATNNA